jgi:hypothetical protein
MVYRVYGLGFNVEGIECGVQGLEAWRCGLEFWVGVPGIACIRVQRRCSVQHEDGVVVRLPV